jgi:phosphate acetyltransferase
VKEIHMNSLAAHPVDSTPITATARYDSQAQFESFIASARALEPVACGVVHPCDAISLQGALDAAEAGLIDPVLIGPKAKIQAAAEQLGASLSGMRLVPALHSHHAASVAAEMAARNELEGLMKGSLHTDEFMHAVLAERTLRTVRRMSQISRFDVPLYHKPLFITDPALNIRPGLAEKRDIVQNAVALLHVLGVERPKVAILSAVEMVNPHLVSTLDAAALCKMADRGQIKGADLDGPLAFDNAISREAARVKGIVSIVAGDADILVVPDVESGNMLVKQLEYLAGASGAGVVLGARIPMVLTSRADPPRSRVAAAAMVKLVAHSYRSKRP